MTSTYRCPISIIWIVYYALTFFIISAYHYILLLSSQTAFHDSGTVYSATLKRLASIIHCTDTKTWLHLLSFAIFFFSI